MDSDSIRHAFNKHGPDAKLQSGEEAISPEALSVFQDVVETFDAVSKRNKKNAPDTYTFKKQINGIAVVVEAVRPKAGGFRFITMWIDGG